MPPAKIPTLQKEFSFVMFSLYLLVLRLKPCAHPLGFQFFTFRIPPITADSSVVSCWAFDDLCTDLATGTFQRL